MPSVVKKARVSVKISENSWEEINNPLYSYKFGKVRDSP